MNFPLPLTKRLILILWIGVGCFLFGLFYYFYTKDRLFFILSAVLLLMCIIKGILLFFCILTNDYMTLQGQCESISQNPFKHCKQIIMIDDTGESHTLQIDKGCRVHAGNYYRFYFSRNDQVTSVINQSLLQKALLTGNFLGYEEI